MKDGLSVEWELGEKEREGGEGSAAISLYVRLRPVYGPFIMFVYVYNYITTYSSRYYNEFSHSLANLLKIRHPVDTFFCLYM